VCPPPPMIIEYYPVVDDRTTNQLILITAVVIGVDFTCVFLCRIIPRLWTTTADNFIEVPLSENYLKFVLVHRGRIGATVFVDEKTANLHVREFSLTELIDKPETYANILQINCKFIYRISNHSHLETNIFRLIGLPCATPSRWTIWSEPTPMICKTKLWFRKLLANICAQSFKSIDSHWRFRIILASVFEHM
jgi:hypothetical protein